MNIREAQEAELDADIARAPQAWEFQRRNHKRTIDTWMLIDIGFALRTIHLGRYRNPAVRSAIREARDAVRKATQLIQRDYWERYEASKEER